MVQSPIKQLSPMVSPLSSSPKGDNDNITVRRKNVIKIPTHNSFILLDTKEDEYVSLDSPSKVCNRSCPEIGRNHQLRIEELENAVEKLQSDLKSADLEIQKLLSENFMLKDKLAHNEKKVNQLKSFCLSSPMGNNVSSRGKIIKNFHPSSPEYVSEATIRPEQNTISQKKKHKNTRSKKKNPQTQVYVTKAAWKMANRHQPRTR